MSAYGDWGTPEWDKEKEVICRHCDGEDDTCEYCHGSGTETLIGSEAEEAEREERESFREDYNE